MIRVGTSGYNYPEWRGSFYPEKFPTKQMLPYYAERFSTVEINYTFYRMPNAKTVAGWDAETPASFSFTLKAPQRITHIARLREIDDALRYFLDTAAGLGAGFAAYVTFTFILAVTPGSITAIVVRNTLRGGRAAGLACACGAAVANMVHALLAGLGLSLLIARWPVALVTVCTHPLGR